MKTHLKKIAKKTVRHKNNVPRKAIKHEATQAPGMLLDPTAEERDAAFERVMTWDEVKRRLLSRKRTAS